MIINFSCIHHITLQYQHFFLTQAESYNVSLAEVREEAHNAKEILELSQQSWEEQEKILKTDAGKLDKRCKDLTAQNSNLHAELEKVSRLTRYNVNHEKDCVLHTLQNESGLYSFSFLILSQYASGEL